MSEYVRFDARIPYNVVTSKALNRISPHQAKGTAMA